MMSPNQPMAARAVAKIWSPADTIVFLLVYKAADSNTQSRYSYL